MALLSSCWVVGVERQDLSSPAFLPLSWLPLSPRVSPLVFSLASLVPSNSSPIQFSLPCPHPSVCLSSCLFSFHLFLYPCLYLYLYAVINFKVIWENIKKTKYFKKTVILKTCFGYNYHCHKKHDILLLTRFLSSLLLSSCLSFFRCSSFFLSSLLLSLSSFLCFLWSSLLWRESLS